MTSAASSKLMTINLGPQHPATHGVLQVVLDLDGETVVNATPHLGYLHTGIEKTAEDKLYYKALPLTDRMDYLAPMSNNLGYVLAVEKLLGLEVPEKVQYVRVLLAEITRLNNHLVWIGTHALDVGAMSMLLYAFREREMIMDIYEAVAGARMMSSYFRIGGLAKELPADFDKRVNKLLEVYPDKLNQYEDLLTNNRIWIKRLTGVGAITAEQALDLSLTGPVLRSTGVNYDLRKTHPYSGYEKFDFEVPLGKNGDCMDRYSIRLIEMRESLKIIRQALDGMPEGPYKADAPGIVLPDKEKVMTEMEALIFHFKIITEGFKVPAGSYYMGIESPKGELGYYMVSDGGTKPYRMRVRPPSLINLQALSPMVVGGKIADVITCIGSIDIVLGEVDR
ncbi:MAG: NADH dehydrogenase (quinone) subunit D [candidate division Zixibacteria bacterium]|nr:NADH dehydrogenase (quinone) subunit D [candidate division Zixibacteria bacterium]